jgi:hypothetical protein
MQFDTSALLGPLGGLLALAFGAGCTAGYAFCLRTVYKLLDKTSETIRTTFEERLHDMTKERDNCQARVRLLEDRLYLGQTRQLEQIRESSVRVLGTSVEDKQP